MVPSDPWDVLAARIDAERPRSAPDLAEQPEPVRRYFAHAVAEGAPWAPAARLEMEGRIKLGRWLPFKAQQLLAPRFGTVWRARVGGVVWGSDRFVAGTGGMTWKLLGLVPLVRADGEDVSRSTAERAAGESIWVPTAVPPPDAVWTAIDDEHVSVRFAVDGHEVAVAHHIDGTGALRSSSFLRWGDPDETGTSATHPFGVEAAGERTFGPVTIPAEGRAGWHFGTDRWPDGVFFEYRITAHQLLPDTA